MFRPLPVLGEIHVEGTAEFALFAQVDVIIIGHVRRPRRSTDCDRRLPGRFLGDDVDDTGQGIGTVLGRSSATDDFDAFNIVDVDAVQRQEVLRRFRIFDGCPLAIDENKCRIAGHAAHGNAVAKASAGVHDLHVIGQAQCRIDIRCAEFLDIVGGNNFYRIRYHLDVRFGPRRGYDDILRRNRDFMICHVGKPLSFARSDNIENHLLIHNIIKQVKSLLQ